MLDVNHQIMLLMRDMRLYTARDIEHSVAIPSELVLELIRCLSDGGDITHVCDLRKRACYQLTEQGLNKIKILPDDSFMPLNKRKAREDDVTCFARTCYGHFAGLFGVQLRQSMIDLKYVALSDDRCQLTKLGTMKMSELGLHLNASSFEIKECVDGTERRFHMSGPFAKKLTSHFFTQGWVVRRPSGRSVNITSSGSDVLKGTFGINIKTL